MVRWFLLFSKAHVAGMAFVAVCVCVFLGCGPSRDDDDGRLRVVTTLFPSYDFANQIGGGHVNVELLLPAGTEAHTFSPTPKDIMKIQRADVFLYTGPAMEPWVEDILQGIDNPDLLVVNLGDASVHACTDHACDAHGDHVHEAVGDPHVWLDLAHARIMVAQIEDALAEKAPQHADTFQANAADLDAQLEDLDARIAASVADCRLDTIIHAGHFAFGRFAERYGLKHVSPYAGFSPDAEPSARDVAELIETMKSHDAKYIFHEELLEPRIARAVAESTGAELLVLHGLHNLSPEELERGETYLSLMERNLENLKRGLECSDERSNSDEE